MEEITQEQRKAALCTIVITLVDGLFDKNDKWTSEEDIYEDVRSYGIQSDVFLITREDGSTVGIPLREIEKFVVKGNAQ